MANYEERAAELGERLDSGTAAILASGANMQYVSGFRGEDDRHMAALVRPGSEPTFVAPAKYEGQVRAETWIEDVHTVSANAPGALADGLAAILDGLDRVLIDDDATEDLSAAIRGRLSAEFGLASEVTAEMRLRKDDEELDRLRRSGAAADRVSEAVRELDAVGMTERELAVEIRSRLAAEGGEAVSFPPVVAAGPNATRGGYRYGEREIRAGEPVVLDFGAFLDGYASDQTRTVVYGGEPPEGFEAAHDAVVAALDAGVEAAGPGVPVADVDAAVREKIDDHGLSEHYTRATGHGVGADAHEPPSVGPDTDIRAEPGTVFSVEPGLYFEGEFGVRVEDVIAVTENGAERLNGSPMTWRPLSEDRV